VFEKMQSKSKAPMTLAEKIVQGKYESVRSEQAHDKASTAKKTKPAQRQNAAAQGVSLPKQHQTGGNNNDGGA